MSRTPLSMHVEDVSALARSLRRQLDLCDGTPGHVEMLNLLVKAGGYKNYQHFKAEQEAIVAPRRVEPKQQIDPRKTRKVAGYFDLDGRLTRWPKKYTQRVLCLWVLWSRLPARVVMTELEIDERLILEHAFCDHALLRRWLVDEGLVSRTPCGREYRRVETQPPAEALAVMDALK